MLEIKAEAEQQQGYVNTIEKEKENDKTSMTVEALYARCLCSFLV